MMTTLLILSAVISLFYGKAVAANGLLGVRDYGIAARKVVSSSNSQRSLFPFETIQLDDAIIANFAEKHHRPPPSRCKVMPGDDDWPTEENWEVFGESTTKPFIKTIPIGAACYQGEHYNETKCQALLDNWNDPGPHISDPTSIMAPLFEGATCQPQDANHSDCTLGGFPSYSVDVRNVADAQWAMYVAQDENVRLVIKNTGHDYLGRSTGAGSLSIWTHHLKDIRFIERFQSRSYTGPAFDIGAGVVGHELYEAANKAGYTAVSGECQTVGVAGGYTQGGGNGPISPIAGLGADQVLRFTIIVPNGTMIEADEDHYPDLFWAVRGGGGATFGIVMSMTVKVWPKMSFAGMTFSINTVQMDISETTFWSMMEAYWRRFPEYSEHKTYGYSLVLPIDGGHSFGMRPWLVPNMCLDDFKAMVKPLLQEWSALGVDVAPKYFETDNFYDAWTNHFPSDWNGRVETRTASRFFPKKNWEDPALLNETMAAIKSIVQEGSVLVQFNTNAAAPAGTPDSAANPAWRDALLFAVIGFHWNANDTAERIDFVNKRITNDWMPRLKRVTPGGGGYGNEGDVMDPDFGQSFFGSNYERLYKLKQEVDPRGTFYAPTAVGSEDWYIDGGQDGWVTKQTGRLCRK